MYDPKTIFTENGYEDYLAHLHNIKKGLDYIQGHLDDLHVGALDPTQEDDWYAIYDSFKKLLPVLKKGDGEQN